MAVKDEDIAFSIAGEQSQSYDSVIEAVVVRKIDLFLIPAMIVGMFMLSNTAAGVNLIFGKDTDSFTTTRYQRQYN